MRRGLTSIIDNEPDLKVCAAASNYREAIEAITNSCPDLVITDFSMKDGDGINVIQSIRSSNKKLPVLY